MRLKKISTFAFLGAGAVAAVCFYSHWRGMRQENLALAASRDSLRKTADSLRAQYENKNQYYNKLVADDKFAERVIRQRLGYAYPDDIVFRFKDSAPVDLDDGFERADFAPAPAKKGLLERALAFFGISAKSKKVSAANANAPEKIVPEYRVDMTGASIAATERKRAGAEQPAPTISLPSAGGAPAAEASPGASAPVSPPQNVRLLADAARESVLVAADSKPVKIKLGHSSQTAISARKAKTPVRFVAR